MLFWWKALWFRPTHSLSRTSADEEFFGRLSIVVVLAVGVVAGVCGDGSCGRRPGGASPADPATNAPTQEPVTEPSIPPVFLISTWNVFLEMITFLQGCLARIM